VERDMQVNSCLPIIPSADLERSLRFWVDGLGLTVEREMREAGRLGCMLGYAVSSIAKREYGQSEFFVTDDDGYSHCFGVPTGQGPT
jgi:catechol 2,3-dioxygenase-like lactoylglutathione lyase family enzyme